MTYCDKSRTVLYQPMESAAEVGKRVRRIPPTRKRTVLMPSDSAPTPLNGELSQCSERELKGAQRIWDTFRFTLLALFPGLSKGWVISTDRSRRTRGAILMVRHWVAKAICGNGVDWTAKQVKEYAGYCRARALKDPRASAPALFPVKRFEVGLLLAAINDPIQRRTVLAQLARMGRSMPEAGPRMTKKALIEHARVLATVDPPLEEVAWDEAPFRKYYEWARQWAAASPGRASECPTVNFSASAAESVARSQGGQRKELRALAQPDFDAIRAALFELSPDFADMPVPMLDEDYAGIYSEADDLQIITDAAIRECRAEIRRTAANWRDGNSIMSVRASALPELGSIPHIGL